MSRRTSARFLVILLNVVTPILATDTFEEVSQEAVRKTVTPILDEEIPIVRVAVYPVQNDEGGTFTKFLREELAHLRDEQGTRRFSLLAPREVDRLRAEKGILGRLEDNKQIAKLVGLLQVEGVFYGEVMDYMETGPLISVSLKLRLVNEKGKTLYGHSSTTTRAQAAAAAGQDTSLYLVILVMVLVAFLAVRALFKARGLATTARVVGITGLEVTEVMMAVDHGRVTAHRAELNALVEKLGDIKDRLAAVRDIALAGQAGSLASVRAVMRRLRLDVENMNRQIASRNLDEAEMYVARIKETIAQLVGKP